MDFVFNLIEPLGRGFDAAAQRAQQFPTQIEQAAPCGGETQFQHGSARRRPAIGQGIRADVSHVVVFGGRDELPQAFDPSCVVTVGDQLLRNFGQPLRIRTRHEGLAATIRIRLRRRSL